MRPTTFRVGAALIVAAMVTAVPTPATAYDIDLDDPDFFGPGEAWTVPAVIEPGDSGPWVERLQERLADKGFRPGTPDGRYGQSTLAAVYAFQKLHGLERDGSFRSDYWALLDTEVNLPVQPEAPNRVAVNGQ